MFNWLTRRIGQGLARYLSKPIRRYKAFDVTDPARLARVLRPGDVLLVDGLSRISTGIKYLTQSTWSHAALYVGEYHDDTEAGMEPGVLIEADLLKGVIAIPLGKYAGLSA